jgi:uncharacterized protein (TIGR01777 family)
MRIAITGATGFLGRALSRSLAADGHQVVPLTRKSGTENAVTWDPESGTIEADALEGLGAVVHLAGESIASARWNAERKQRIRQSRVAGTSVLATALAGLRQPPPVLVSASAVGIYGDRGDEVLTESSPAGSGFLAELGAAWERAADPARQAGIRVVHPRFGIVLDPSGGALKQMLLPFRLGIGGPLGTGRQWVSWMTRGDAVRLIRFAIDTQALSGAVNAATPHPVTFRDFARALGRALHRPAVLPVPAFALRLRFGELADALLLASQRAVPAALTAVGFRFEAPELEPALRDLLAR